MKPTIEVLENIYLFAKTNDLQVKEIRSSIYENTDEFRIEFERGVKKRKQKSK